MYMVILFQYTLISVMPVKGSMGNRFLLTEIQLVLLTDVRFNAFKSLTEEIHIYLVDLLLDLRGKRVHPGQGNQIMALVEDLRPLTVHSQE